MLGMPQRNHGYKVVNDLQWEQFRRILLLKIHLLVPIEVLMKLQIYHLEHDKLRVIFLQVNVCTK